MGFMILPAIVVAARAWIADGADLVDPAPPEVRALSVMDRPEARAFDGLTTHRSPRPIPEGAQVHDWPTFMGPHQDGRCLETGLLSSWPDGGPALIWEADRGDGYASPVIAGDMLVSTFRQGSEVHIDALELETGRRFWRHTLPCTFRGEYIENNGPRSSPAIDDGVVYVHGVAGELIALELTTGRVLWQRDLNSELGVPVSFFGVVSSPLIFDGKLIQNVGATGGPCVAAFDTKTGRMLWSAGSEWGASCASPVMATIHGAPRVLVLTGGKTRPPVGGLMVIDPSDGAVVATYPFRSKTYESVNGASPVAVGDSVFLTASYGTGSALVDLSVDGGLTERWHDKRFGIQFGTPIQMDGALFVGEGAPGRAGYLTRLDPQTGVVDWRAEVDETVAIGPSGKEVELSLGEGSLLGLGDRVLCLGDSGLLALMEPGDGGARVIASAAFFHAGETWTPPVVSHGILLLCQNAPCRVTGAGPRLMAFDLRAAE